MIAVVKPYPVNGYVALIALVVSITQVLKALLPAANPRVLAVFPAMLLGGGLALGWIPSAVINVTGGVLEPVMDFGMVPNGSAMSSSG